MEFGPVGSDLFAGNGFGCPSSQGHESKNNSFPGSERSKVGDEHAKPASKAARTDDFPSSTMLRFSCPNVPDAFLLGKNGVFGGRSLEASTAFPYFHQIASSADYGKIPGYTSGGINAGMYVLSGVKGPFTPSQWLELQHQALIYKHFITNEPIPPNLLIPIRKALESARFFSFTGDPSRPNAFAWGPFRLGFSNSIDPEPGRCRRTDGKKWRCTRDAVADQKYCERHINRGRHRSRKPVEGQTDSSVSRAVTAATTTSTAKLMPVVCSSLPSMPGGGASNRFNIGNQQFRNWVVDASDSPASSLDKSMYAGQNARGQNTAQPFLPPKHHIQSGEVGPCDFGVPSTESLLNISQKITCVCSSYASSQDLNNPLSEVRNCVCQGISSRSWSESEGSRQSISVPTHPLDFMSSTSSSMNDRVAGSELGSSLEHDLVQWGLGVGNNLNEPKPKHADWIPISWESSSGGPLGEVLHCTKGSLDDDGEASGLNLLIKGWHRSPQLSCSSPTGAVSNSSAVEGRR